MCENANRNDRQTKKIPLEEGRRLASQIFDRPRPKLQKLSAEDRKKLDNLRTRVSDLIKSTSGEGILFSYI